MTEKFQRTLDPASLPMFSLFVAIHLACFAVIFTGVSATDVGICLGLFALRIFGITAGYHRYFAHRAFKTSRGFQFLLGFLAESSLQSGLIWWASKHRDHHRYVDTPKDAHSPREYGFWFSHLGWIFNTRAQSPDLSNVPDITRYPELVWLDKYHWLPGTLMGLTVWWFAGWSGLVVGFFLSTVLVWHSTFAINSLAHVYGKQRYLTGDDSRNNWWLALLTFGEGWHNNHHYYMSSVRQGFYWWEIDITFYLLKALSWCGLVWDLKQPPAHVRAGQRQISAELRERVAQRLALSFSADTLALDLRQRWQESAPAHAFEEFKERLELALAEGRESLAQLHFPELPSLDELRGRADRMFARSPAMDDIVERARLYLTEAVARQITALPA